MRALVVFESMFGNTGDVAGAVADGVSSRLPVETVEVGTAPSVPGDDVVLLVVGGPTHALGLSRAGTRADAGRQASGPLVSTVVGIREWLDAVDAVDPGSRRVVAAAFDTRVAKPRLPGSAAKAAVRRLRRLGFPIVAPAASFFVDGTKGPLLDGELDRARAWGAELGAAAVRGSTECSPGRP